jgi:alcohol dehydrogenase, propanol-preferring
MRSQAIVEFGSPLKEIETATPQPSMTEVLLAAHHAGVCHSDVHMFRCRRGRSPTRTAR